MQGSDLVLNKSVTVSDADSNGGRMSYTQVSSNVLNNMFPNVTETQRTSGVTRYRKFFFRNKNSSNETGANSRIWVSLRSTGGDYYRMKAGTDTDVQSAADDYTDWLGTGYIRSVLAADSTTILATFDNPNGVYNGSLLRLSDSSGGEEFLTVKAAAGVSWNGNNATILCTSGARATYPASQNCTVAGVVELGSIICATGSWVESSVSGTYDEATYPVQVNNNGTVTDTWTLTFTSATTFSVTGTNTGLVGTGSRSSDFQPINALCGTGDYYFILRSAGWGGTWATAESVTFSTTHSAKGVWIKEVVPAGTAAATQNTMTTKLYTEGS